MNVILIRLIGVYLIVGFVLTFVALQDDRIVEDLSHYMFIGRAFFLLIFIVVSPAGFVWILYDIIRKARR